jgi:hypothetical protein
VEGEIGSVAGPSSVMSRQARGDEILPPSLHPRIEGLEKLILTMMAIGVLLDSTVKTVDLLREKSPTRLVELRKIRVVLSFSAASSFGMLPQADI